MFYKGQKVRCIDKEYGGHWYGRIYNSEVCYGKDPDKKWHQHDIKYGEICTVTIPHGTSGGGSISGGPPMWVQKDDGGECLTLYKWFVDAELEIINENRKNLIDKMLEDNI